ncbi:MAG: hypothetical protein RPT25_15320 [Cycloclasticus sp.]
MSSINFVKLTYYTLVIAMLYVSLCVFFLVLPFFSNVFGIGLPNDYLLKKQQELYNKAPMRSIWQGDAKCAAPNKYLGYAPKLGECAFENFEFATKNIYTEKGWLETDLKEGQETIIVVGDSHAMGWGVDTSQTFSGLLSQNGMNVINLANSSWGTEQEIRAVVKSEYFKKSDYIIIQYCDNDAGKNVRNDDYIKVEYEHYLAHSKSDVAPYTLKMRVINGSNYLVENFSIGEFFLGPLKPMESAIFGFEYSEFEYNEFEDYTTIQTESHLDFVMKVINGYPELLDKKIIIFYSNGWGKKFTDFDKEVDNVEFVDFGLKRNHYYWIDDHLNESGHRFISNRLMQILIDKND